MIRKAFGTVAIALVAVSASGAARAADQGFYVRIEAGASLPADLDAGNWLDPSDTRLGGSLDTGAAFGIGVGYRISSSLRADVVLGHHGSFDWKNDVSDRFGNSGTARSEAGALTGLVNLYYDVPLDFPVKPYIGAGIGFARTRIDGITYSLNGGFLDRESGHSETNFAWALMGGASYELSDRFALDVGYRYLDAGDIKTSGRFSSGTTLPALKSDLHLHEVMASLRYRF